MFGRSSIEKMLKTETYDLLQDRASELYAESPEHVWGMMQDERNGNWEAWLRE